MTRIMLDALNSYAIPVPLPEGATMVAGYIDLADAWTPAAFQRFTNAGIQVVTIARSHLTRGAMVADCEPGCIWPPSNVVDVAPVVYCSESNWLAVRAAYTAANVAQPEYWVAAYPGTGPSIPPGAIGHQYADTGAYDISVMTDYIEGIDNMTTPTNIWQAPIPFTNADGTVTQVAAETVLYFADLYAGQAAANSAGLQTWMANITAQLATLQKTVAALVPTTPVAVSYTMNGTLTPEGGTSGQA